LQSDEQAIVCAALYTAHISLSSFVFAYYTDNKSWDSGNLRGHYSNQLATTDREFKVFIQINSIPNVAPHTDNDN